jgi:hypothetical protein
MRLTMLFSSSWFRSRKRRVEGAGHYTKNGAPSAVIVALRDGIGGVCAGGATLPPNAGTGAMVRRRFAAARSGTRRFPCSAALGDGTVDAGASATTIATVCGDDLSHWAAAAATARTEPVAVVLPDQCHAPICDATSAMRAELCVVRNAVLPRSDRLYTVGANNKTAGDSIQ